MRRVLIVLAMLTMALPAAADECAVIDIEWTDGFPAITRTSDAELVNVDVVGTFLWVQPDRGNRNADDVLGEIGTQSVELTGDESSASICPDGTVTFETVTFEPASAPSPRIVVVPIDTTPRLMVGRW